MAYRTHDHTRSVPGPLASGDFPSSVNDSGSAPQPAARRRMDRRLAITGAPAATVAGDLVVKFPHRPRVKARDYDFTSLEIPQDIATLLAIAAQNYPEPLAYQSQKDVWQQIRRFARFVREDPQIRSAADVNTAMINRYRAWLNLQTHYRTGAPWSQRTQATALLTLQKLINTVKTNCPDRLPSIIVFPAHCYPNREPSQTRHRLDRKELRTLWWCCHKEIAENRARLHTGQQILNGDDSVSHDPHLVDMLNILNDLINSSSFPTWKAVTREMDKRGITRNTLTRLGGVNYLLSYLFLTPDTAAPYYVSLLVQLAGNVEPVRLLTRDCVRPDPTRDQWNTIEWEKARSGRAPQHIQIRSFPSNWQYGPPKLVADLLMITEPLVSRVASGDQNKLFLAWNSQEKTFGVISYTALTLAAQRFLSRAATRIDERNRRYPHRKRALLPEFELRDLRPSTANEHYLAHPGDIRHVQRILNHSSSETTEPYINGPLTRDLDSRILSAHQRKLVDNLCNHSASAGHNTPPKGSTVAPAASFGNECRDPQPRLCPEFQKCLDCPGLVIPVDAKHLAVLLRAERTFESARQRLHPERWRLYYADSYRMLKHTLKQFPEDLRPEAQTLLASLNPLPELE